MVARSAAVEFLEHAGRGQPLEDAEWGALTAAWLDGSATDVQMAAMLARAGLSGLRAGAQAEIVEEVATRGDRLDLTPLGASGTLSASAVGDPTELLVPPIVAALGVPVCVVATRGRGRLAGTIDKLECVSGFRRAMSAAETARQVRDVGVAVVAAGDRLAPGVARLEGLLEQTGAGLAPAVAGPALAAHLLVSGARTALVTLSVGAGGILASDDESGAMASLLSALATRWGREVRCVAQPASLPAGPAVGGALEVGAAGATISGGGEPSLRDLAAARAGLLAEAAGAVAAGDGAAQAARAIDDGRALASAERWLEAQGGDPSVWTTPGRLPEAPYRRELSAGSDGILGEVDAGRVGEVARWVGAGRLHASQAVDPVAGIELLAWPGQAVVMGEPIAVVHSRDAWQAQQAVEMLGTAIVVAPATGEASRS